MRKSLAISSIALIALTGCSVSDKPAEPAPTVTVTATPTVVPPATQSGSSIDVAGEESGSVHFVEYRAYSRGGPGANADASVRWTTKILPEFEDFSEAWKQTMAFEDGEWASVLVTAREDVFVGCELYFDGELVDSQGMDSDEYKVECKSYVG